LAPAPAILLEVAVASADDALIAAENGAHRLELNAGLELGGLTPSLGVLKEVRKAAPLPIIVMLRPRAGGFVYSAGEFKTMQQDCDVALSNGADGIAFGILHGDHEIDVDRCRQLIRQAGRAQTVFHRAFDVTAKPLASLDQLIELGATRLLTSGGRATAPEGAAMIARLVERSGNRIEILPGGGVRSENVVELLRVTGCNQVHGSFSEGRDDPAGPVAPGAFPITSGAAVRAVSALLDLPGASH
jgi:copper homeostasis protein